ncbi:MAG: NAD-dependent epimerase/dehydratase family protein [Rhodocyclales bacterium]|nr:NAD-dependent epimerase/dehydratase family protein [Rhodocyclales bacterium]
MTVLVTGATGFIGGRLRRSGDRVLARDADAVAGGVRGDLLDRASLRAACAGIERVFHCAGYAHAFNSADPDVHWRVNCEGTRNLVDAAGEAGVRRFVFLSSVKAMAEPGDDCIDEEWPGEPDSAYGRAKRAAEDAVLAAGAKYGMHVVNLRLAMVYGRGGRGNLERMARGIRAGWFPRLPDTRNKRSLVHVDDVVEVMRLVADAPAANGRTYIVADPRPYSGREIFDAISGVPPRLTFHWGLPAGLLRAGAVLGDMAGRLAGRPMPVNSEVVGRLLGSACYSPARIERELGWRARTGLHEGVREMLGVVAE